jgi:hypothetical protein
VPQAWNEDENVSKDQLLWIELSRSRLEHNVRVIRDRVGPELVRWLNGA